MTNSFFSKPEDELKVEELKAFAKSLPKLPDLSGILNPKNWDSEFAPGRGESRAAFAQSKRNLDAMLARDALRAKNKGNIGIGKPMRPANYLAPTRKDILEAERRSEVLNEDLSLKDTELFGIKTDSEGNLINAWSGEYVNELKTDIKSIPKIPEGSTKPPISYAGKTNVFTIDPSTGKAVGVLTRNQREAFEKSLAGRTDVQGTNDQINPSWNKNQSQASVQGLKTTEATADPVESDYNSHDAIPGDERLGWKSGETMEWNTDMDIDAPAEPVSGMSAGGAMAINAGVKIAQAVLADKDRKDAETTRTGQLLASAMGKAGNQRTSQLGWMDEYNLWKRFTG